MTWQTLALLALAGALLGPAQDAPPALRVTIRDVAGAPVVGAEVTVTDASGTHLFARTTTDTSGVAEVPSLPGGNVRVRVAGKIGNLSLSQDGQDATGILLVGQLPIVLTLRVEPDGRVIPDPAAMLALEADGPLVATPNPTVEVAMPAQAAPTQAALPTASQLPTATATPVATVPAEAGGSTQDTVPIMLLAGLFVVGLMLLGIVLRWGRPA